MTFSVDRISLLMVLFLVLLAGLSLAGIAVADATFGDDSDGGVATVDSGSDAEIDRELQDAEGEVEVIVRFESADRAAIRASDDAIETLKANAQTTQDPLQRYAKQTRGVSVKNNFWIANAALVTINMDRAENADIRPLEEIAALPNVDRLHKNFEVTIAGVESASGTNSTASESESVEAGQYETTYGLDMINAPEVWDQYDTRGEGVGVAVLDTGVDADHPDLKIDPANWQEFDDSGNRIETEPNDGRGHGTHVSGTVVGPVEPAGDVPAYGVAPEAELYHGKVLNDEGSGTFAKIIAGMEWAVDDTDAEIVSMSLGADGYLSDFVEPSENAREAGVVLVTSAGNSGEGTTGTPGNVYPNFASGAVDENHEVAEFSSGGVITTADAYPGAPDYWPEEYTVPNAAAPGVDVLSAMSDPNNIGSCFEGEPYCAISGTSMSAPHKAGAFALMLSASGGDVDRETLMDAMEETAWKPDDWDVPDDEYDTRYGLGIIDVAAATEQVAVNSGITGTVTDTNGTPIEGATVSVVNGQSAETDAAGVYGVRQRPGTYDVTADAFGSASETKPVTIQNDSHIATLDFALADTVDVRLTAEQSADIVGGETVSTSIRVVNVDELVVEPEGTYDPADATLLINGEEAAFGEPVTFDGYDGEIAVGVQTLDGTGGTLGLTQTVSGHGDETSIQTGPTTVHAETTRIGVVDDDGTYGENVTTALNAQLPGAYRTDVITSNEAIGDINAFDGYVVQKVDWANANEFVTETNVPTVGVVYLDQWGTDANGIGAYAAETGDPTDTFESYDGQPPIRYDVETSHEILGGFTEGETVDIQNANYPDHTWFNETEFKVLATVDNNDVTKGPALAVNEDNKTVLASSLGRTQYVGNADYTTDADEILANSVEYAISYDPEFRGTVTVGGNPAPEGAVVKAYIDGELRGSTVVETAGEYGSGDVPLAVDGTENDEGTTVTFTVDGLPVAETATWSGGSVQELDLNASGTATIDVELGDNRSGGAITEPTVTATGEYGTFEATQTGDGQYAFENLPADTYAVTANATGYDAETNDSVTVGINGTTAVDFWLVGDGAITGTVGDAVTDRALSEASVTVTYPDGTVTVKTAPDDAGSFTIGDIPGTGDAYTVDVTAPGYETTTREVVVNESTTADLGSIALAGSASIAGTAVDADGEPLPNATVTATAGNGSYVDGTGDAGAYLVEDVPGTDETYELTVELRGYESVERSVENVTGDVTGVDVTLNRSAHYFGVDDLSAPESVDEGDDVTVEATIVNLGTDDWNDTATLRVDGDPVASRNVSLNGTDNASTTGDRWANASVTFTHSPDSPSDVTYGIATANETVNATVAVEESSGGGLPPLSPSEPEPSLYLVGTTLDTDELVVGETGSVTVTVSNTGDAAGEQELALTHEGAVLDTTSASVPAGERVEATLAFAFDEPGTYSVAVDGDAVGSVEVSEAQSDPANEDGESDSRNETDSPDDTASTVHSIPGFGIPVAIVALVSVVLASRRRH